ncbi:MAG: RNA polymerase sigma-I factor [Bacillaceae bacterium]|nr:RNA polymerase sigma-I factor [Bacillaceae bacterium]
MLEETVILRLVEEAQNGNESSRRALIEQNREYVKKVTSSICKRPVRQEDDEMSIGLIAFNEAIDRYQPDSPKHFYGYARMIIESRLIDYFRREKKHQKVVSMEDGMRHDEEGNAASQSVYEVKQAVEHYQEEQLIRERAEEIRRYSHMLKAYGIQFSELEAAAPKHRDSRATLVRIARDFARDEELVRDLKATKKLPLKKMARMAGVSRKTLERSRKYLIAIILILTGDEFVHLKSTVRFPDLEGGSTG